MQLFITGTDTGIGKTLVATWLAVQLQATYWKPVQTGSERDTAFAAANGVATVRERHHLKLPAAPAIAARQQGITITAQDFSLPPQDPLIVEGAGGVLVPLAPGYLLIDLISDLGLPALVVASSRLGTINHTCLTIMALKQRGIAVVGIIMNHSAGPDLVSAEIEMHSGVPVLAHLPSLQHPLQSIPLPAKLREALYAVCA